MARERKPPWYGTVHPVVWEDGGGDPASYPLGAPDRNEMILLNLDRAPGRGMDHTPPPRRRPKPRSSARHGTGAPVLPCAGRPAGTMALWQTTRCCVRDGKLIDHAAIGTFYFDPGASLDRRYEIVAVDGDGNRSTSAVTAQ